MRSVLTQVLTNQQFYKDLSSGELVFCLEVFFSELTICCVFLKLVLPPVVVVHLLHGKAHHFFSAIVHLLFTSLVDF